MEGQEMFDTVRSGGYDDSRQGGGSGFAVASLALGLVSLVGICCCAGLIDIITIPLALIFGIISLVKKRSGTGLAITGIITSAVSLILIGTILYIIWPLLPHAEEILNDYSRLTEEQDTVFATYEETGEIPDYLKKYTEAPFDEFFERYDATFYDVMDALLDQYKDRGSLPVVTKWNGGSSANSGSSSEAESESASAAAGMAAQYYLVCFD